jgi:hypothetical protein
MVISGVYLGSSRKFIRLLAIKQLLPFYLFCPENSRESLSSTISQQMTFNLLRIFSTAVVLYITGLPAWSQNSSAIDSFALTNVTANDSASFSKRVLQTTSDLNRHQTVVLGEVRRGHDRLLKSCSAGQVIKPPDGRSSTQAAITRIEQLQTELDLKFSALNRKLLTVSAQLQASKSKACPAFSLPFLKSEACQSINDVTSGVQILFSAMDQYQKSYQARYEIYRALVAKENEGCVRAGFSERLLKSNESQMEANELLAIERFASLINLAGAQVPVGYRVGD